MNKIICIYSNNIEEAEQTIRDALSDGYNQPILLTKINNHTPYTKQFEIKEVQNMSQAKDLTIKRFGSRADFGIVENGGNVDRDPEKLKQGPRKYVSSDVVIPYHKEALPFIVEAVDSILNQNYANIIVHLISDGIPTEEDCAYIKYKDIENIRTYYNKPSGPYIAVNRVFQFLETDYISIMDADDIALPNRIWRAVTALEKTGSDIYGGAMEQFIDHRFINNKTKHRLEIQPIADAVNNRLVVHGTQTSTKSVFEELNGYGNFFCGADGHYIYRAIKAKCDIYYSKHIVAMRRLHSVSLTNNDKHGSDTKFRRNIQQRMELDYKKIREGADISSFGSLRKYKNSKDIIRTN